MTLPPIQRLLCGESCGGTLTVVGVLIDHGQKATERRCERCGAVSTTTEAVPDAQHYARFGGNG